jgi:hypothetical protein
MGGIPKFLLPTGHETETLLGRWISFGLQHFDQIIIPTNPIFYPIVSTLFEAEKVRVAQVETNSMAETVALFKGPGHTCVFMPDTYVSNIEQDFAELATVTSQVNSCFVGTWKIRDYQKGKVGQLDINIDGSLAEVIDKDPLSELERFWGGCYLEKTFSIILRKRMVTLECQ